MKMGVVMDKTKQHRIHRILVVLLTYFYIYMYYAWMHTLASSIQLLIYLPFFVYYCFVIYSKKEIINIEQNILILIPLFMQSAIVNDFSTIEAQSILISLYTVSSLWALNLIALIIISLREKHYKTDY